MVTLGGESAPGATEIAAQVRAHRWARHLGVAPDGAIPKLADAIAAFRRVPGKGGATSSIRIRRWNPRKVTWPRLLSPNGGPLGTPVYGEPLEYAEYTAFYNQIGDPA
ncbi:hypothetical protein NHF46_10310 [Arthrobacter alpinus]|nr:hypothetical protein [Arthrobacter alpinus]